MSALKSSDVHYIRCIKPNSARQPGLYDRRYVMSQLLACGIIETVEISQQGFPARYIWARTCKKGCSTHFRRETHMGTCADSADLSQALQNVASDQGQYDLLAGISVQNELKIKTYIRKSSH